MTLLHEGAFTKMTCSKTPAKRPVTEFPSGRVAATIASAMIATMAKFLEFELRVDDVGASV